MTAGLDDFRNRVSVNGPAIGRPGLLQRFRHLSTRFICLQISGTGMTLLSKKMLKTRLHGLEYLLVIILEEC